MAETTFDVVKFSKRLKELMEDTGHNTYTLADAVFLTPGTISKYVNARMEPKRNTIELLAKHFKVNPAWLMGYDVDKWLEIQAQSTKTIPYVAEETTKYEPVPIDDNVDFCLSVSDDSMINARIFSGDIAFIRKQPIIESGEIAAIEIDGATTIRRIYISENGSMILHSENPTIPDKIVSKKDKKDITILGKVIYVKFKVR